MEPTQPTPTPYTPPMTPAPSLSPQPPQQETWKMPVAIVIGVLVLAGGAYALLGGSPDPIAEETPTPSAVGLPVSSPTAAVPADWETYTNTEYGFEFRYPANWNPSSIYIKGPLNAYKYENPPAGTSFVYSSKTATWSPQDDAPSMQLTATGIKWFETGVADGLGGASIGLIPITEKNVMAQLWVGWGTCIEETGPCPSLAIEPRQKASQDLDQILSTFKFTKPAAGQTPSSSHQPTICTADAMRCPDGSYVGRTGPNCQFVCP